MRAAVLIAIIAAVVAAGCDAGGDSSNAFPLRSPVGRPSNSDSLVIGLVGTMTGPQAWRGEDAFEGADLAVHELNEALGANDRPYELVSLDDKGNTGRALELVRDLVALDRTVGILYAGPPGVMPKAEDDLADDGIPAVSLYGDLYGADRLAPHLFQSSASFLWEARRFVNYFESDRGYARIGLLASRSPSGRTAAAGVRAAARAAGIAPVIVVRYRPGEPLGGALARLRRRNTEAVIIEGDGGVLAAAAKRLKRTGNAYRGTAVARLASAPKKARRRRLSSNYWHPQLAAFDTAFARRIDVPLRPGTVVSAPLARGAYYLPVPSFTRFRKAFEDWWGQGPPLGWQQGAYEAAHLVGWAVGHAGNDDDLASTLEGLHARRFGGQDVNFGPEDHVAVDPASVGLWVVPRPGATVRERDRLPGGLPWVPLSRGFSSDGRTTDIAPRDWRWLVRNPPRRSASAPSIRKLKFGVNTGRGDPVH
jgi:ABC-type branched-subunit amino acid transport system substrate-binding protein